MTLLELNGLITEIGATRVVDGVSLSVGQAEIVGLVGESGSGKSMTAFSIIDLFPTPAAHVAAGSVHMRGQPFVPEVARGKDVAMIFQDPSTFLDPVDTIGNQVAETLRVHGRGHEARQRVPELLSMVGLAPDLGQRYPHELSGGQRQRALIAAAIAAEPALLIADEPTTALDVTVQAGILQQLLALRERLGLAVLLITHDLGVVAEVCDRVYVMYAAKIVETNTTAGLFASPRHPYTQGLIRSVADQLLFAMPGFVPSLQRPPNGCRFHPRCPLASGPCFDQEPPLQDGVACWHTAEAATQSPWEAVTCP